MLLPRLVVTKALLFASIILARKSHHVASLNEGAILSALKARDLAGVWCLTQKQSFLPSGKKFATETSNPADDDDDAEEGILLKLSADGTYVQCTDIESSSDSAADTKDGANEGVWDYVDGKLMMAPNRREDVDWRKAHDTLLVGRVACQFGGDTSTTKDKDESTNNAPRMRSGTNEDVFFSRSPRDVLAAEEYEDEGYERPLSSFGADVFLSVPRGSIEIGKFMYPRKHRQFFEQPMHESTTTGTFGMKQILGALNTNNFEDEQDQIPEEKYRFEDLQGKRFFLMSRPLREEERRENKGSDDDTLAGIPINVKTVELFSNCTFRTIAGVGSNTILRGKWDLFGEARDQLWMKVSRFGLGRSISGSVYSEGAGLSHEDAKTYWGEIKRVKKYKGGSGDDTAESSSFASLTIDGTVFVGGLSAEPVAKFSMVEDMDEASSLVGEEIVSCADEEDTVGGSGAFQ